MFNLSLVATIIMKGLTISNRVFLLSRPDLVKDAVMM